MTTTRYPPMTLPESKVRTDLSLHGVRRLFATVASFGPSLLRLAVGAVMLAHGLQKVSYLFGGQGWSQTRAGMVQAFQIPDWLAPIAMLNEVVWPALLLLGLLVRPAALFLATHMAVAMVLGGHFGNGLFIDWTGQQAGQGVEFHLVVIGACLALVALGGGKVSVDRAIARRSVLNQAYRR